MHTPEQLTDEQIVALRDQHLPSQGEPFDCIAFARAILLAQADASPSESLAELLARANTPTPVGYMHPEDFREVREGGWINTTLSREPVPFAVPVYAEAPAKED